MSKQEWCTNLSPVDYVRALETAKVAGRHEAVEVMRELLLTDLSDPVPAERINALLEELAT